MKIEAEIRSFISKNEYDSLLSFFRKEGRLLRRDKQETYYFDCKEDLRIQRSEHFSKIWLKKGKIHDDCREEIEIKFNKGEFDNLEKLFLALGHKIEIKWFRTRHLFKWRGVRIAVDYTKGYGHIIELEKITTSREKSKALLLLRKKLEELDIKETPKKEFEEKFSYYKKNWKKLTK